MYKKHADQPSFACSNIEPPRTGHTDTRYNTVRSRVSWGKEARKKQKETTWKALKDPPSTKYLENKYCASYAWSIPFGRRITSAAFAQVLEQVAPLKIFIRVYDGLKLRRGHDALVLGPANFGLVNVLEDAGWIEAS